jgi:predicted amidophosphoribosyltransferase
MSNLLDLTLRALTRCICCDLEPPTSEAFPLCSHCYDALIPTQGLGFERSDQDPENDPRPPEWISSQYSLFSLTDSSYKTLRRWKTRRGLLFDRRIWNRANVSALQDFVSTRKIEAIIPMPQSYARSWKMGGSPADVLANWVSEKTGLPKQVGLRKTVAAGLGNPLLASKRQAELQGWERLQTRFQFEIDQKIKPVRSLLLVDDFSTTGHTLQEAARALRLFGFSEVHTLCLGIRVSRIATLSGVQRAS